MPDTIDIFEQNELNFISKCIEFKKQADIEEIQLQEEIDNYTDEDWDEIENFKGV